MSEVNKTKQSNKPVQDKLGELAELVTWFQSPNFTLEAAVEKFQQAEKLATEIETDLTKVKNDIKIIKKKFDTE